MLIAALKENGFCSTSWTGIARDDRMSVVDQIRSGLSGDVLITTGGVSMGEKVNDYM